MNSLKKRDLVAGLIGFVLAITSYMFYEQNAVLSVAIFLAVVLVYRRYIKNEGFKKIKKFKKFGDEE
ncbi:hypothetical protein [uncultured Clostridium sp.]|jgi:hypothetical protein|uniref:hypothetical protein n=1 Tax=uncultured Clostridium sp. TaxID=59620 RepID=UPI0026325154|nr:hypothetical protein [uncultured Clostridium sp.]